MTTDKCASTIAEGKHSNDDSLEVSALFCVVIVLLLSILLASNSLQCHMLC